MKRRAGLVVLAASTLLAAGGARAAADVASLKAACTTLDAADGDTSNGVRLPYRFCDDGVPSAGGRTPNPGAVKAVAVPQRYGGDGFSGLPPKASPDPNAGADAQGNVALDVDVSLPDPVLNPPPPSGYPLVVMMHGCCSGDKTGWERNSVDAGGEGWHYSNAWFAARGYVVLTYTSRGFVNGNGDGSTGETQLDSRRYEINDYQHLAGHLADDPFFGVDPQRVVATGGSYGGGFSWMAATDPTWTSPGGKAMRLVAAAPKFGWTDLVYSLVPNGRHMRDALPPTDPARSATASPIGYPKRSIVGALFVSGRTGIPTEFTHATFPPSVDQGFACLQTLDPAEVNPLCASTLSQTLPSFLNDRSAYHQNGFFSRIASDPDARTAIFSAGTFTDPLFTLVEHRRMSERLESTVPGYPVQEYYGDYQHFVQNKAKEWGDLCGADRHVCRLEDYPGGDLDARPSGFAELGIVSRLNRFIDHYARPPSNPEAPPPATDVTASLQVCPANAGPGSPADEPGDRFTAPSFDALATGTLTVKASGTQATSSDAVPNPHSLTSDPVENQVAATASGRPPGCPTETSPGRLATAGPGVATYDSAALSRDYVMIGRTRVSAPYSAVGSGLQLNARLYDLFPDGTQVMVDRGVLRLTTSSGTAVLDLHGNAWRFPRGHRLRIELAQDDDPYVKSSSQPSALALAGVTLQVPVRQASDSIRGRPASRRSPRLRLSVAPRRVRVGRRTRFRFRVRSRGRAVRGATIRFAGKRLRTNRRGRVVMSKRLRRARLYRARASRRGYRGARGRVRAVRLRPRFTG